MSTTPTPATTETLDTVEPCAGCEHRIDQCACTPAAVLDLIAEDLDGLADVRSRRILAFDMRDERKRVEGLQLSAQAGALSEAAEILRREATWRRGEDPDA